MRIEWKGGKLTKKRAAFLCWKMWEWIATETTQEMWNSGGRENADGLKVAWPHWTWNGGRVEMAREFCFACEWTLCLKFGCPDGCLLSNIWPDGCCHGKSPFSDIGKLKRITAVQRRAKIIAEAARKVYEGCK